MANENGLWTLSLPTSHALYGSTMSTAEMWIDPRHDSSAFPYPKNLGTSSIQISSGSNSHPFYIDKSAGFAYIDDETILKSTKPCGDLGQNIDIQIEIDMDDWGGTFELLSISINPQETIVLGLDQNIIVFAVNTTLGEDVFYSDPLTSKGDPVTFSGKTIIRARWMAGAVDFYRSTSGGTWQPLGSDTGTGGTLVWNTDDVIMVGRTGFVGKFYKLSILDVSAPIIELDMANANTDLSAFPFTHYPTNPKANAEWIFSYGTDPHDPRFLYHTIDNYVYNASGDNRIVFASPSNMVDMLANDDNMSIVLLFSVDDKSQDSVIYRYGGVTDGFKVSIRDNAAATEKVLAFDWWDTNGILHQSEGSPSIIKAMQNKTPIAVNIYFDLTTGEVSYYIGTHINGSEYDISRYSFSQLETDTAALIRPTGASTEMELMGQGWNGGKIHYAHIHSTPAYGFLFQLDTRDIQSGEDTSIPMDIDLLSANATIERNSSFGTLSCVTRPVWNFINGSYLFVDDDPSINFNVVDSFTLMAVCRYWDDPRTASLIEKRLGSGEGYSLKMNNLMQPVLTLSDGTNTETITGTGVSAVEGELLVVTAVVNRATNLATVYVNGVAAGQGSVASLGTFVNSDKLYIGSKPATANPQTYGDFELFGLATWRRALSADDIKVISDGYTDTKFSINDNEFGLWLVSVPTKIF